MADEQLRYKLTADDSDASRVLDRFRAQLEGLASKVPVEGFEKFGAVFAAAGPIGIATAAIAGFSAVTHVLVKDIDDLDEAAQGIGTTAVALSQMRIAAQESGVGAEQLTKALAALNSKAADAASGNALAAAAFDRIGVAVRDSAGKIKPTEELLGEISDRIKTFADDVNKGSALADVFGQKLGPRLAAYLNQGSDSLQRASGLTQDMVDQAVRAQKEIDKFAAAWDRLKLTVGGTLAGALNAAHDIDEVKIATVQLTQATAELQAAQASAGGEGFAKRANDFLSNLFGGDPDERVRKAQATVDRLNSIINNVGTARFTAGSAARVASEFPKDSLPDKEDAASLERNQQALASYVQGLQSAIDSTADLTKTQEALRAISTSAFGPLISGSKQAQQLLLGLAAAADKALEQKAQTQFFTQLVLGIEQATVATEKLSATEQVELAIARNPRAFQTQQQLELARAVAARADQQARLNQLLEEQTRIDEQTQSITSPEQRTQELRKQLVDLSGIADEMRKISLTNALEDGLNSGQLSFTAEQLDRIVKGIAGIADEAEKASTFFQDLGHAAGNAFEELLVGGRSASDVFNQLAADLERIAIRKYLTGPFDEFMKTLDENKGDLSFLGSIFGGTSAGGGGTNLFADPGSTNNIGGGALASTQSTGSLAKASARSGKGTGDVHVTQNINIDARGATDPTGVQRASEQFRKQAQADWLNNRARKPSYGAV